MLAMEKAIYVTGITGFIGRNLLIHLLDRFEKVINFTRRDTFQIFEKENIQEDDITSDFIQKNPSKSLINLATLYQPYPKTDLELKNLIEANVLFPSRTIDSLRSIKDLKIINASSYHQLLDFSNQNIYSLSKELLKRYLEHLNQNLLNIYIFDTFGAGDTRNKVTDTFIRNILNRKDIKIPQNDIYINLCDSEAISTSIIGSLEHNPGNYLIKSPNTISLNLLAEKIMKITDIEVNVTRENHGINFIDLLTELPKNIFISPDGYNFEKSLEKRILEIKNGA